MDTSAHVRRFALRAIDIITAALVASHVRLAGWRDRLDPPPPVDAALTARILARVLGPQPPIYQTSAVEREAAQEAYDRRLPVSLVHEAPGRPCYVVQDVDPYRRVRPS